MGLLRRSGGGWSGQKKCEYERDVLVSVRRWGNVIWLCLQVSMLEERDGGERGMCCWRSLLERTATVVTR